MALFVCDLCNVVENTSLGFFWGRTLDKMWEDDKLQGLAMCSQCAPPKFRDGGDSELGTWHNKFQRRIATREYIESRKSEFVYVPKRLLVEEKLIEKLKPITLPELQAWIEANPHVTWNFESKKYMEKFEKEAQKEGHMRGKYISFSIDTRDMVVWSITLEGAGFPVFVRDGIEGEGTILDELERRLGMKFHPVYDHVYKKIQEYHDKEMRMPLKNHLKWTRKEFEWFETTGEIPKKEFEYVASLEKKV